MADHRIRRKDVKKKLKEDEVAVFIGDFRDSIARYLERYCRLTFWLMIGVVLVVGSVTLWRWKQTADFARAQDTYAAATALIGREDYSTAESTLTELIDLFGEQESAPAALTLRAFCRHKLKDLTGALNDYQSALDQMTDEPTRQSIRISIAQCYRSLRQTDDAVRELESLREQVPATSAMRDQITYLLARCKEELNQPGQALALYKEIRDGSDFKRLARDRIAWLEAQPVAALNPVN